ncbi:GNAT family N-acetyltransferase [Deinococcus soli (ex Cha et al. 2016)]|uniref:GCN5 family acetyltransferase n=1 Tax=Deinococcus soli (ex Cha et al. 2016) TaxID=1309411 RepID=A0A0F7JSA2_9DEIO|nr:GNAT family protein [Deinococcus soli (ex Cha et al. 2016)]AKH17540.1 GCN5 family acetyltransferase [Deinococcus soli (ex Cha et al. 2016)]
MPVLQTPRLLLPLSRAVIARRLEAEAFTLPLPGPDGPLDVTFGPEWPGDPLPVFPGMLAALTGNESEVAGSFIAVQRDTGEAVGMLGTKGSPSPEGAQEIGYGFNPAVWGQGLATEGVGALVTYLHAGPHVRAVTAETAVDNPASARVLTKLGFRQVGRGYSDEDGPLILWAHTAT